jgi:hypothetical protein
MISIYFFTNVLNVLGVAVIGGSAAVFVSIAGLLRSRTKHRELGDARSNVRYQQRFAEMKADAQAKYGPSVRFLRPEIEIGDDPEAFERAWREFEMRSQGSSGGGSLNSGSTAKGRPWRTN